MSKRLLSLIIVFLLFFGVLYLFFKRLALLSPRVQLPEVNFATTPYPTWEPKQGAVRPTVIIEKFPYITSDKTRKIEIVGCILDNSDWGMSYPKKTVDVPNVSAITSETMRAFLVEASVSGWGGFPTKNEVEKYFNKPGEVILKKLTIDSFGLARIYFSSEVKAYGGGSARVACMQDSVELTLKQFSNIKNVIFCIEDVCSDQKGSEIFQP